MSSHPIRCFPSLEETQKQYNLVELMEEILHHFQTKPRAPFLTLDATWHPPKKVVSGGNPAPPQTLLNIEKGVRGFLRQPVVNLGSHEVVQDFLHQPTYVLF